MYEGLFQNLLLRFGDEAAVRVGVAERIVRRVISAVVCVGHEGDLIRVCVTRYILSSGATYRVHWPGRSCRRAPTFAPYLDLSCVCHPPLADHVVALACRNAGIILRPRVAEVYPSLVEPILPMFSF